MTALALLTGFAAGVTVSALGTWLGAYWTLRDPTRSRHSG